MCLSVLLLPLFFCVYRIAHQIGLLNDLVMGSLWCNDSAIVGKFWGSAIATSWTELKCIFTGGA